MKKLVFLLFSAFLLSSCSHTILNLSTAKREVANYYENGEYDREMNEIINSTINKLEGMKFSPNSAAVFDIDETVLNNYPEIKRVGFGSVDKMWDEWTLSAKAKAIPQTKKLYDYLVKRGVKIFFITGRDQRFYDATIKNLKEEGYNRIDTLICRKPGDFKSASQYKAFHRKELVNMGADIIINVGDQWSDSEGGNSGLVVKLPDYLYLID